MKKSFKEYLLLSTSVIAIGALSQAAQAQQIIANGTTVTVPAGTLINTGTAIRSDGTALFATNAGTINTLGAVILITGGEFAHAVHAGKTVTEGQGPGTINLTGATLVTTGVNASGIMANVSGSVVISTGNLVIRTTGNSQSNGIRSELGSTVQLSGVVDVTTFGSNSSGVVAIGASIISDAAVTVHTEGNNRAHAITAYNNGSMVFNGSVNATTSGNSLGMQAANNGTITANEAVTIRTTGGSLSDGIVSQTNSLIELNGKTTASTLGSASYALLATHESTINVNGVLTAATEGAAAHGLYARADSTVTVNAGGDVTTRGDNSNGLYASGVNSKVTTTNANVATFGSTANSIHANNGGFIGASGGNLFADGLDSRGAFASSSSTIEMENIVVRSTGTGLQAAGGSTITVSGGETTTSGSGTSGILAQDGSTVTVTNSQVKTLGANAAVISSTFLDANRVNIVSVSNSTVSSAQGDLVRSEGGLLNVTLDSVTTNNGGAVLRANDDAAGNHSTVNFSALNTILNGDVIAQTNNIANLYLTASSLTGAAYNATNISLDTNSVWNMTASSTVSDTVTNAGQIVFASPLAGLFKTLTTTNYIGNIGTAVMNTFLGADGSPSDRIIINGGAATGQTALVINNVGGPGASTTDGVKVVRAINGGTTTTNAFFLGNGDYVTDDGQNAKIAGAFAYTLHRSAVTPGTDGYGENETNNDWYLRSTLSSVDPNPNPDPNPDPNPNPDPDPRLRLHPGVPIYEVYPATLLLLNRLPTAAQRTGNRYWREQAPAQTVFCKDPAQNFRCTPNVEQNAYYQDGATTIVGGNSVWGRIEGLHGRQKPDVTTSRTDYDYNQWKLQAGVDGQFYESDAGKLIGGVTTQYGRVSTDASSIFGKGKIDTTGYGFGGTLSWYGTNEFYLDAQGQVTWFDSDLYSDTLSENLANGNKGFGYAFSLEGGKRIALNENWILTPQAQLSWSSVRFDSFTDPYGARVSQDKSDSMQGRLGLALGHEQSWKDAKDQISRMQVYGILNLYNEFMNGTRVDVSGEKFDSRADRQTGGVGLGGTYSWANDKYTVFGEVNTDTSLKNFARSYEVGGTLGLRIKY